MTETNAVVRSDWVMPKPNKEVCPDCNGAVFPGCYWTGEGWLLEFACDNGCYNGYEDLITTWPFTSIENGFRDDLLKLGFLEL